MCDLELCMAISNKDLPTSLMSTVSAQATKRATCGEQEVGLSWFSLRQRSNSTNSLEQSCLIFWITGLSTQIYKFQHPYKCALYFKDFKSRLVLNVRIWCLTVMMYTVQPSSSIHGTFAAMLMGWRPHMTRMPPFLYGNTWP